MEVLVAIRLGLLCSKSDVELDAAVSPNEDVDNATASTVKEKAVNHKAAAKVLYAILNALHFLEYLLLAWGVHMFCTEANQWRSKFCKTLSSKVKERMRKNWKATLFVGLSLFAFTVLSLVHPILGIVRDHTHAVTIAYHIFTFVAHLITSIVRAAFTFTVLVVRVIWFDISTDDLSVPNEVAVALGEEAKDTSKASRIYYQFFTDYHERARKIIPLLRIFDEWFVVQWIHYFSTAVVDFWVVFQPWLHGRVDPQTAIHHTYPILQASYLFSAFIIAYLCGTKLHRFHVLYYREVQDKMDEAAMGIHTNEHAAPSREHTALELDGTGSMLQLAYVNMAGLRKIEKCDFAPTIRLVGLGIPVAHSGYILGVLLSMFLLVGGILKF